MKHRHLKENIHFIYFMNKYKYRGCRLQQSQCYNKYVNVISLPSLGLGLLGESSRHEKSPEWGFEASLSQLKGGFAPPKFDIR